jgi:hypothetical protein
MEWVPFPVRWSIVDFLKYIDRIVSFRFQKIWTNCLFWELVRWFYGSVFASDSFRVVRESRHSTRSCLCHPVCVLVFFFFFFLVVFTSLLILQLYFWGLRSSINVPARWETDRWPAWKSSLVAKCFSKGHLSTQYFVHSGGLKIHCVQTVLSTFDL